MVVFRPMPYTASPVKNQGRMLLRGIVSRSVIAVLFDLERASDRAKGHFWSYMKDIQECLMRGSLDPIESSHASVDLFDLEGIWISEGRFLPYVPSCFEESFRLDVEGKGCGSMVIRVTAGMIHEGSLYKGDVTCTFPYMVDEIVTRLEGDSRMVVSERRQSGQPSVDKSPDTE